jgi:DNA modification methylase
VQCVVTSPPYYGLRDYGTATWVGGDAACDHVASQLRRGVNLATWEGDTRGGGKKAATVGGIPFRGECGKCGAVREDAQIGLEPTPEAFVAELVAVFREVRRVLRDDGTLWLNLGDSYAGSWGAQGREHAGKHAPNISALSANQVKAAAIREAGTGSLTRTPGLKAKDLIGIPWRVAFALQADGWYLRSDIIWHKPNPMPESVTDRPTKAHEYLFLLSKSPTYYYDSAAIAEPCTTDGPWGGRNPRPGIDVNGGGQASRANFGHGLTERNRRTVWTVATQPYSGAHFATFPSALIEPCILAGSARQACETCGAPWERAVEYERTRPAPPSGHREVARWDADTDTSSLGGRRNRTGESSRPTCACETNTGAGRSVVLDPFGGAGTTGLVADRLGRDAILIDLNPDHTAMAKRRVTGGLARSDVEADIAPASHDFGPLFR